MTTGIYMLSFPLVDGVYIGQSVNIEKRFRDHKSALSLGRHTNYKMQNAYNLYGYPTLDIIERCDISNLDKLEIAWTEEFSSINNGLNIASAGKGAGSGIYNHNSKYSKLQLLRVFRKLYMYSELSDKYIGDLYGVNESTVTSIRLGFSHIWLKETWPKQYAKIKPKTSSGSPRNLIKGGVYLKDTKGIVHHIENIRQFAKENNLDSSNISKVLNGRYKSTAGWTLP